MFLFVVLSIPSWPLVFLPQHFTPPPVTITHVQEPPTAMAVAVTPGRERGLGVTVGFVSASEASQPPFVALPDRSSYHQLSPH
jgi:hypothetical protein